MCISALSLGSAIALRQHRDGERHAVKSTAMKVLSIAFDVTLGETRRMLLENAGFSVTAVFGGTEAMKLPKHLNFDVVVIGHCAPLQERIRLAKWIRKHIPHAKLIALQTDVPDRIMLQLVDYNVDVRKPDEWLRVVAEAA
jgi:DNA-binding NarL/FixJ family response regulator